MVREWKKEGIINMQHLKEKEKKKNYKYKVTINT